MFRKITLERTACFGTCPVYKLEITNDGNVTFHGSDFVKQFGIYEWVIDEETIKKINRAIKRYKYFQMEMNTEDVLFITCNPSCITSIIMCDGRRRWIDHYHGGNEWPELLNKFEDKIDKLVGTKKYIGSGY